MPQRNRARASSATGARSAVPVAPDPVAAERATHDGPVPAPSAAGAPSRVLPPSIPPERAAPPQPAATTPATTAPATTTPPTTTPAPAPAHDVRALARVSLAAGRSPSLWWVCTGVAVAVVVTYVVGPSPGAVVLAGLLAVSAVARAVLRPGPVALTVRSRLLDSAMLAALAAGIGMLSQLIPTG